MNLAKTGAAPNSSGEAFHWCLVKKRDKKKKKKQEEGQVHWDSTIYDVVKA
jgi:hypothetical protein